MKRPIHENSGSLTKSGSEAMDLGNRSSFVLSGVLPAAENHVLMQTFLRRNGTTVNATEDERYDGVIAVAWGDWPVDQLESWLGHHLAEWPSVGG
jgi:hypothetical protein